MMYAVNITNGEHRLHNLGDTTKLCEVIIYPNHEGWLDREELQELPIEEGMLVDIEHRDGDVYYSVKAMVDSVAQDWDIDGSDGDIVAYRPIFDTASETQPKEWDGEGYPPVGTVCKMICNEEMTVKILAYGKHSKRDAVLVCKKIDGVDDQMLGLLCDRVEFEPIKSEEDKVVEDMKKITFKSWPSDEDGFRALYRAGYRKTEDN